MYAQKKFFLSPREWFPEYPLRYLLRRWHSNNEADFSNLKLKVLRRLGWPTIPFSTVFSSRGRKLTDDVKSSYTPHIGVRRFSHRRLLMSDLTENGKNETIEVQKLWPKFNMLEMKKGKQPIENLFPREIKNRKTVAKQYKKLCELADKLGVGLGAANEEMVVVVNKSTQIGRIVISDVGELYIPAMTILANTRPKEIPFRLKLLLWNAARKKIKI